MKTWLMEHRFALLETFARIKRQPSSSLLNVIVVSVALALPFFGYIVLADLEPVTGRLAGDPEISVFLRIDTPRADAHALGGLLRGLPGVASADFVSRETALQDLRGRPGMQSVLALLKQNPLPDAWIVHMRRDPLAPGAIVAAQERLAARIRTMGGVEYVQIDSAWVQRLDAFIRFLRLGLLVLATTLGFAVIAIIFNTIRMQVLTQREEIEVSRLIGATPRFIRRPFYYVGALQGFAGGVLALGWIALALLPLNQGLGDFAKLSGSDFRFTLAPMDRTIAFLGLAALLGWLAALLSVGRHLNAPRR